MNNKHYARKTRQLKRLVTKVNDNVAGITSLDESKLAQLLGKVKRLIQELIGHLGTLRLKHILGASAVFFGFSASAQSFEHAVKNPFNLQSTAEFNIPTAVDLDGDGDLDIMSAEYYGAFQYFENTGSKRHANFDSPVKNAFGIVPGYGYVSKPTFADLDGDGDMDMLTGGYEGVLNYYENTGSSTNPSFANLVENPFGLDSAYYISFPTFVDLDDDGDFDLMVGEYYGNFKYFKNVGTANSPLFTTVSENPFNLKAATYTYFSSPTFADVDGDGDMDMMSSGYYGALIYYKNVGTKSAPSFAAPLENPFALTSTYYIAFPSFIDIDDDGDFDLLVGEYYGNFQFFRNSEKVASVNSLEAQTELNIYPNPARDVLNLDLSFVPKSIRITDVQGRTILSPDYRSTSVDISLLDVGTYFIQILNSDGMESSKMFIKE
ncbi:MAG: T9SS type A sorting domain-containing protein [Bacteroidia bacterium]|nr:T9SS type A sorting domain-containing protein [Bacteroidia bacterium]